MLQRSRSFHVSNRKEKKEFVPSPQIPLEPTVIERSSLIPYSNSPFPAKTLNDINLNHFGESAKNLSKLIFDLETNSQSRHDVIGLAQNHDNNNNSTDVFGQTNICANNINNYISSNHVGSIIKYYTHHHNSTRGQKYKTFIAVTDLAQCLI